MEKDLQKKCIDYVRSKGLMAYSLNPPSFKRLTYGTLYSMPDIHVVDFNAFFELKDHSSRSNHKEHQEKQLRRRTELVEHNALAYKVAEFKVFKLVIDELIDGLTNG